MTGLASTRREVPLVLAPEAVEVVVAATRLIDALRDGPAYAVFGDVLVLQRVLADMEVIERRQYDREQCEAIERAAGLALTHEWRVIDSHIACARCPVDAGSTAVISGAVPACTPDTRCAPFAHRHFIVGAGRCVYCKVEYPATATATATAGGGGELR